VACSLTIIVICKCGIISETVPHIVVDTNADY